MKKVLALILSLAMMFALLTACRGSTTTEPTATAPAEPSAAAPTETAPASTGNFWDNIDFSTPVTLTYGISGAAGKGTAVAIQNAIDLIAERSGGAITIELVGDGALGNEASLLAQAMEGSVDIAGCAIGITSQYSQYLAAFQMPFLINSYELEAQVLQSDEWKALVDAANADLETATIISATEFGMRHFAIIDKPINTIADVKGLKLRTGGNPVIDAALTSVGANPVNVAFTELYSALQNGLVDGEEINATSVSMQKHYEVVHYMSEIGFYPWLSLGVMSNAVAEALPAGYYDLIKACIAEADATYMQTTIFEWDAQARQDCVNNGVVFNEIQDKDKWIEAMAPLYSEWSAKDPLIADFISAVQAMA